MEQEKINKQIFDRIEYLEKMVFGAKIKDKILGKNKAVFLEADFSMGKRAFIKKYGKGLSGPKKFVLMLAYLSKGKIGGEVKIEDIKKNWNKMTSLFEGEFNTYYSTMAKDNNWADSKKHGVWFLVKDWKNIFA